MEPNAIETTKTLKTSKSSNRKSPSPEQLAARKARRKLRKLERAQVRVVREEAARLRRAAELEEWREFFKEHEGLSNADLAIIAGCSARTIKTKKKLLGMVNPPISNGSYNPGQKADRYTKITDPAIWDNREWFVEMSERQRVGMTTIGKIVGKGRYFILRRVRKYGINVKQNINQATHECCNEQWLVHHYCIRSDYLKWCEKNGIKPDKHGGMGLSTTRCAAIAQVTYYTIINWLAKFGIYIRSNGESEAIAGAYAKRESHIMEATTT